MKKNLLISLTTLFPLLLLAQQSGTRFDYDASGNRTGRNTIILSAPQQSAPNESSTMPKNDEKESGYYLTNEEEGFVFGVPENNELFNNFYTDRLHQSDVVIFPNPIRGALAVEIRNKNLEIPHQITVLNLSGSIVFQKNNIENFTEIDLSSQPSGVYLLRISSPDSFITWKIIKE
ncbi:MAG: T9SS type A sorting domain-containing protein [Bacteroidales bacterium]|nr:T9SS type A sorting domain-containing protein [Bacteroidales bacterium]